MNTNQLATTNETAPQLVAKQAAPSAFVKPVYEVETREGAYIVRVFAPGASRDSVRVLHERGSLSITASRDALKRESWKPIFREISEADYRLQLQLNVEIDAAGIEAKLENGVLNVTLPVAEEARPRVIAIE